MNVIRSTFTYKLKSIKTPITLKQLSSKNTNLITTSSYVENLLLWDLPYVLPFLVKLTFIKTIRAITPSITYQYVLPQDRTYKTYRYFNYIRLNSGGASTKPLEVYNSILKI